jgi:ADP-ribose pyrophosphatase YjhB (NUDIX family)
VTLSPAPARRHAQGDREDGVPTGILHRVADEPSSPRRVSEGLVGAIRPIAAAVIREGDRLLVWEDYDPASGEVVCVPLAGGIEFGETGAEAITRELEEEIGQRPSRVVYLGLLEDIFDWNGQKRHELYLVFDVELEDTSLAGRAEVVVTQDDGTSYRARWRHLDEFRRSARLVPDGLLDLVERFSAR